MATLQQLNRMSRPDLIAIVEELEARFEKLYTNCPATPTIALKRNPHMLGDDDNKCWMQADLVFAITHPEEQI